MDILDFAIEKEQFSEDNYRRMANDSGHEGFSLIFNMLADEEFKHRKTIEKMKEEIPKEVTQTDVLGSATEIFGKIRADLEKFKSDGDKGEVLEQRLRGYIKNSEFGENEVNLYKKARDFEKESQSFYLKKSKEVESAEQKEIFLKLAEEERKHFILLDNLVELMTEPESWLENAEWRHSEDY